MSGKSLTTIENGQGDGNSDTLNAAEDQKNHNNKLAPTRGEGRCRKAIVGSSNGNDIILPNSVLEKLYHSYSIKQRLAGLIWFLAASILFDIWSIIFPQGQGFIVQVVSGIVLILNAVLCVCLKFANQSKALRLIPILAPHLAWLLAIIQLVTFLCFKEFVTPREILAWGILINFLIYVTLPVQLIYTGIILGIATFAIYIGLLIGLAQRDPLFWKQIWSNIVLTFAAANIGLLCYVLGEAKQRRAFLEAKKSLEVKMIIEEQSAEQERLLLSVLPKHVAEKMRQDLGSTNCEQFKKIYMSRHENVSILYADIVGFTAISSTYSAQDLVKMLNELFARFDRLADKYQQLRIKILGDCYYCISGAPDEKPDHAVLCVHMGLSMVKAIKYVQQKTNSPVDMRVGIHTGAVLAGILGQRQWQFDVYSKDVELANKMESSGKAGRVHISEKTLGFLNGEFEIEPAFGEKREEALRIAGLKTYFIKKVLIPFVSPETKKNGVQSTAEESASNQPNIEDAFNKQNNEVLPDDDSKVNSEDGHTSDSKDKVEDFKKRLQHELVARDGHGDLSKDTTIFLSFKTKELEDSYALHREPFSSVPLLAAIVVQIIDVLYSSCIIPRTNHHFLLICFPVIIISYTALISIGESFPTIFPELFVQFSKKFNNVIYFRRLAAVFTVCFLAFVNLSDMYFIADAFKNASTISNSTLNLSNFSTYFEESVFENHHPDEMQIEEKEFIEINTVNFYPSYLSNFGILILIAIAVIAQLTHICKIGLLMVFTALTSIFNIYILDDAYTFEDFLIANTGLPTKYNVSAILLVAAISLSFLARHMDREDRVIFKWKSEVAEQKEKATDMRRRNEALVYNVLPVHVAEHFMKNTKRSHDDLYSQSYAEVGVLFASMPNFSDFYTEETVNNQGLECLRFLNEVISDYDALLELPQFKDIIKIKTISSTYMAASGINPSKQVKPDDPFSVRWAHLDLLVQFALELKKALHGINEQSFNHFVLKMGINHGPITAGVIGARKPHYDIWGNTVNVASRMESTGKAGSIQVTEETCKILEPFGYTFEQRGLVLVKGKGQLMTYYLQGKEPIRPEVQIHSTLLGNIDELPEVESDISKNIFNLTIDETEKLFPVPKESDPRSPKSLLSLSIIGEEDLSTNNIAEEIEMNKTTIDIEKSDASLSEKDIEIEIIKPLLNQNSTNNENQHFLNSSESDSLIAKK